MDVQWKVLRYPSWRLCQCTVTFIAPWQCLSCDPDGKIVNITSRNSETTNQKQQNTHFQHGTVYRVDLSIDTWKKLNHGVLCWLDSCSHLTPGKKNHMIDSVIFTFTWLGDKNSDMKHVPPHLRPQRGRVRVPFLFIKKGAQGSLNKRNSL